MHSNSTTPAQEIEHTSTIYTNIGATAVTCTGTSGNLVHSNSTTPAQECEHNCTIYLNAGATPVTCTVVWCPDPSTNNITACANACAREGKKGLGNNYTRTRALDGMQGKVLVCSYRPHTSINCRCGAL